MIGRLLLVMSIPFILAIVGVVISAYIGYCRRDYERHARKNRQSCCSSI